MKGALFTAWAASLGLVTWKAVSTQQRAPLPSEVAASVVVFGVLSLAPESATTAAAVFGWGLVVAGAINVIPGIANLHPPGGTGGGAAGGGGGPAGPSFPNGPNNPGSVPAAPQPPGGYPGTKLNPPYNPHPGVTA